MNLATICHLPSRKPLLILTALVSLFSPPQQAKAEKNAEPQLHFERHPSYFSSYSTPLTPTPSILLRFNAPIDITQAAKKIHFSNQATKPLTISAKISRPSAQKMLKLQPYPDQAGHQQNFAADHFILVQALTQLPVDHQWSLVIPKGFTSSDKKTKTSSKLVSRLGYLKSFKLRSAVAQNPYDGTRSIALNFNKRLHPVITEDTIAQYVKISPQPDELKFHRNYSGINISGKFHYGLEYKVSVTAGLPAFDQTFCQQTAQNALRFTPNAPFVHLPAFNTAQNLSGKKDFSIIVGNTKNTAVRIKKLDGDNLIFALRGYGAYSQRNNGIPFEMVPGRTIYTHTWLQNKVLDDSESINLNWGTLLKNKNPGAYYLCAEAEAQTRNEQAVGAQALIQLTDIGLAWKKSGQQVLLYAFSHLSGQPLPEASLTLFDNDAIALQQIQTDREGLASINLDAPPLKDQAQWLEVRFKGDRHVIEIDNDMDTISLWRFDVPYRYYDLDKNNKTQRRTLIFTDRPVYKPGETVQLKCLTRLTDQTQLLDPASDQAAAKITVTDSRHRTILTRQIKVSPHGSIDQEIKLPENTLGRFQVLIDFNPAGSSSRHKWRNVFSHSFQVADYRPNTFEIKLTNKDHYQLPTQDSPDISVPVSAHYFMGKALSSARLSWHASANTSYPRSKEFEDYIFGDRTLKSSVSINLSESLDLTPQGNGNIQLTLPGNNEQPLPLHLYLNTEITDINQQTVAASTSFTVHSSDFYLGMSFPENTLRSHQPFLLSLASIGQDGKPYSPTVKADLKIERLVWNTVKVRGAGGTISHRNQSHTVPVLEQKLTIQMTEHPETGMFLPSSTELQLDQAGDYIFTLTTEDASHRPVISKGKIYIYDEEQSPSWSRHDGTRIDVIADKISYRAGDTAKLLIKSPITGHALITVEREGVRRSFTKKISSQQSVIDIPIENQDAPNVFVSVLIIRGIQNSSHQHPDTEYRLGYAQLKVDDPSSRLTIDLATPSGTVQPGQNIELSAQITDHQNNPVRNAEVTLYAVDEGVLSLTGYATPDPSSVFNAPYPLSVFTGQSVSALLPENPNDLDFANKGYVVGGGGPGGENGISRIRKNFKALAYWNGSLISDDDGKIHASFPAPDSLTEYRVIAVVNQGQRFASTSGKIIIQKPLIIEPSLPVFANVGDQIDLRAVLHNNSKQDLDLEIRVELDQRAKFLTAQPNIIPTAAPLTPVESSNAQSTKRSLHIAAGKTYALQFPVIFTALGDAKWTWSVRALNNDQLLDRVESTIPVTYPLPLLRHSQQLTLHNNDIRNGSAPQSNKSFDLLAGVDPALLKGDGSIRVSFSNSRMIEALDAVDYLLKYPYGCVEQTTSSTLPWLSTQNLRKALPSLKRSPEEISEAIAYGCQRLLSMQTQDGGLAYWPGSSDSILWGSAYGGMALALAEKNGADLPANSLQDLWKYLSSQLRNSGKITSPYSLSQRCLTAYTLTLAGHPENAYHDLLFNKRHQLPLEARALLALAMLESDNSANNQSRARQLLGGDPENAPNSQVVWYGKPYTLATQLLAWSKLQPGGDRADQLAGQLLKLKQGPHVWGSTYNNAWPMLAIAQLSLANPQLNQPQNFEIQFDHKKQTAKFAEGPNSLEFQFPFSSEHNGLPLLVTPQNKGRIYAQVEVSSQPALIPFAAQDHGFSIRRSYQRIQNNGALSPPKQLSVGDLILVTLHTTIDDKQHYLAIEDRLPAIFEAINPSFKSQTKQSAQHGKWKRLYPNHSEIRKDRVLFFQDYLYQGGNYTIQYLARVIAPGSATAPPAKIEAMYEPQRYGLSATERLSASASIAPNEAKSPIAVR
ncbi:MAG: alpha-2-macroglobulin family protein [Verrucomicrobiota bacterium]